MGRVILNQPNGSKINENNKFLKAIYLIQPISADTVSCNIDISQVYMISYKVVLTRF